MSGEERVIMVTGGTGMVGSALKAYIESLHNPHERWVFLGKQEGDLRSMEQARALFDRIRPTHVVHLAAHVGGLYGNMEDKVRFYRDNMAINDSVLWCAHEFKTTYPIVESVLHGGPPHFSNEGYAYAKRMIDVQNRLYHSQFGDHFTSFIPTNVLGPNDRYDIAGGHVVPGLIHKCYLAKKHNTDLVVWGDGTPLRQFIYAPDLAKLIHWTLNCYDETDPIILAPGEDAEVSIGDVARMVARVMHFDGRLIFDATRANGQFRKTISNAKLRRYLPDFQFTPLEQAIQESADWFVANYDRARK